MKILCLSVLQDCNQNGIIFNLSFFFSLNLKFIPSIFSKTYPLFYFYHIFSPFSSFVCSFLLFKFSPLLPSFSFYNLCVFLYSFLFLSFLPLIFFVSFNCLFFSTFNFLLFHFLLRVTSLSLPFLFFYSSPSFLEYLNNQTINNIMILTSCSDFQTISNH